MGTLLYGYEHDVAYTYHTAQQCKQTYYPESGVEYLAALVHLHVLGKLVPDIIGALVIGGCTVAGV